MVQFQQEIVRAELYQRATRVVFEVGISLGQDFPEFVVSECVANEGFDHAKRDLFIRQASESGDVVMAHLRPAFGDI